MRMGGIEIPGNVSVFKAKKTEVCLYCGGIIPIGDLVFRHKNIDTVNARFCSLGHLRYWLYGVKEEPECVSQIVEVDNLLLVVYEEGNKQYLKVLWGDNPSQKAFVRVDGRQERWFVHKEGYRPVLLTPGPHTIVTHRHSLELVA